MGQEKGNKAADHKARRRNRRIAALSTPIA
jgi:hypothetical protein